MGQASDLFRLDRFRTQARQHAAHAQVNHGSDTGGPPLPVCEPNKQSKAGRLNEKDERGPPHQSIAAVRHAGGDDGLEGLVGAGGHKGNGPDATARSSVAESTFPTTPLPAPPPNKSEDAGSGPSTVTDVEEGSKKPPISERARAGCKRFALHTKKAMCHSRVLYLLPFVPLGIAAKAANLNPSVVFALNAVALVALAKLLGYATEGCALRLGDTLGALLNVSFGNAVELIIFIIALKKGQVRVVQAAIIGSLLANLLLILGMAFVIGGLRYREQRYNSTVTNTDGVLLCLGVSGLVLPTAFHAAFNDQSLANAATAVLRMSRGTSVVLLLVYGVYLLFQLKSHAYMYESTPQAIIDEESHPGLLADMLGSSSSSEDSSSTDSTDSDTSGSLMTTGKKIRRKMFRRRRRKSVSSISSNTAQSSVVNSALSSPTMTERSASYWEAQSGSHLASRRESALDTVASGYDRDTENEGYGVNGPRIRDFVNSVENLSPQAEDPKHLESKKRRKKHAKKHHKKHRHHSEDGTAGNSKLDKFPTGNTIPLQSIDSVPKAGTIRELGQHHGADVPSEKLSFNMRQLPARAAAFRPILPKMLSSSVFVQPAPQPEPTTRPLPPIRAKSAGALRRTNSLPDRLNNTQAVPRQPMPVITSALPPYQYQRREIRKIMFDIPDNPEDEHKDKEEIMSRTTAVVLLLVSTALVAICAEFMVDAIPGMIEHSNVSQTFIGLIILPIVGNAAEHVTAVTMAAKNKMDLAIKVAVGSSIQIALFITPVVILLGWIFHSDISLYFPIFQTVSVFATVFIVNFLILDGRTNYLEGTLLIAVYVIIALAAFLYPSTDLQSALGGAGTA